ncbi:MAG: hypothetical protein ACI9F9_000381 [Candidatus Paceibacteria bacterium]|jgi:hypothetical protein
MDRMKNPIPTLFPIEPICRQPIALEMTEEIEQAIAELMLQIIAVEAPEEEDSDEE